MFKCYVGGHISLPGEKAHRVVAAHRKVQYFIDDKRVGIGTEIDTEVTLCQEHATGVPFGGKTTAQRLKEKEQVEA